MARRMVLFVLALVIALMGSGAVFAYASRADDRALAATEPTDVLLVKARIKAGTTALKAQEDGLFELFRMPRRAVPAGALKDIKGFEQKVASVDLLPGEVALAAKFVDRNAAVVAGKLPIPPGKMAVSVALVDPARVGGHLEPGNEVAVFNTFTAIEGNQAGPKTPSGDGLKDKFEVNKVTRLLLPRVKVLAIGGAVLNQKSDGDEGNAGSGSGLDSSLTLTLAVDQRQAEKLVLAGSSGRLHVALLNDQSKAAPSDGVDNRHLFDTAQ